MTSTRETDLDSTAVAEVSKALRQLFADVLTLFVKTKGFHWHVAGRHFRDDHLLLDEQATQVFAMVDDIAELARKIGGTTLRSIGEVTRTQRLRDNDGDSLTALEMLGELLNDNRQLANYLRSTHDLCDRHGDVATASLIENWLDETERRSWFLREITRDR